MEQAIEITNLCKLYILDKKELMVLENVDLKVASEKFISIIGPSGCGKSTLFRTIAGLEKDFTGSVFVTSLSSSKPSASLCPFCTFPIDEIRKSNVATEFFGISRKSIRGMTV